MSTNQEREHSYSYIPNSAPEVKRSMLDYLDVEDADRLFSQIPEDIKFKGQLELPQPFLSEQELRNHMSGVLAKNRTCLEYKSYLGGGCWSHFVPAVCDEINHRSEFLTSYAGDPYEDHGRFQALFEYESLVAELVDMDVVSVPTYSWAAAASFSLRMASRMTGRHEVLVPDIMSRERFLTIKNFCEPHIKVKSVDHDPLTGGLDLEDLSSKISPDVAAVYFENPAYLGFLETQGSEISSISHDNGALCVVGVDPLSLGIVAPPSSYGADLVCGELQPMGVHMNFGGGLGGFIASDDDEKTVKEYPLRLFGMAVNSSGERAFADVAFERTSFADRNGGKDFVGTMASMWGLTAGVYLALMGPKGIQELGRLIMQRSRYAMQSLAEIRGVTAPLFKSPHFKEFVVVFDGKGKKVKDVNRALLDYEIFGGIDLSGDFPRLGNSSLYCVNETHTMNDIHLLADAMKRVIS